MSVVVLSGGNSADMRTAAELSERQRRPAMNALIAVSPEGQMAIEASRRLQLDDEEKDPKKKLSEEERQKLRSQAHYSKGDLALLDEANDLAIVAFTKNWTRPEPITLESVLDLPGPDYDALRRAVAPMVNDLFVRFTASKDPDSPTAPSSGSATRSEGEQQTDFRPSGEPIGSSSSA